ncbi:hypothetical protein EWM64_g2875 [Hericium alpestre]|uniref:Uncharacterized protein n=1 Tax=Hericium alpestre TaxID=135208 RepID=A0A4Z0A644_9AGAM|nr:hypothetical protein EWM64_g2875 [Hericium alpestre]
MKFSIFSSTAAVVAVVSILAFTCVDASPCSPAGTRSLAERDVWSPPISSPSKGDVWTIGSTVTVSWDASNPPKTVTNNSGRLLLGYLDGTGSENLDIEHPLAQYFDLRDGKVDVSVPNVPSRDSCIVVLLGDSGNASPTFTIA